MWISLGTFSKIFLSVVIFGVPAKVPDPVHVSFFSDHESIEKGGGFSIGVNFEIEKGWHIYAKEPGEGGAPTVVNFIVPEGFEIKDSEWPEPTEFTQTGEIKVKGYENKVLIKGEVKAPNGLSTDGPAKFEANVKWVSCSETLCIPQRKKLSLELPVGVNKLSSEAKLF